MTPFQCLTRCFPVVILPLLFCSCLEVEIRTVVNPGGSLVRSETVSGDSAEVSSYAFLSPVDATWTMKLIRTDENKFKRTASKLFEGPQEFSAAVPDTGLVTLPVRAVIDRRFLWFYSDMTYRERYLKWNPFGRIPVGEYLTPEDIARSMNPPPAGRPMAGEDSVARERVGQKWTEWMTRDMFEGYYDEFVTGVKRLNDPSLTPQVVASRKEEIYMKGLKWWASGASQDTIGTIVQSIFRNLRTAQAIESNRAGFDLHSRKLALVGRVMGKLKAVSIEMPGMLIDSNAPELEGNRGVWKGVADMSYVADYELWMTSRVVNWWMVILTALVILGGLVYILVPRVRA